MDKRDEGNKLESKRWDWQGPRSNEGKPQHKGRERNKRGEGTQLFELVITAPTQSWGWMNVFIGGRLVAVRDTD